MYVYIYLSLSLYIYICVCVCIYIYIYIYIPACRPLPASRDRGVALSSYGRFPTPNPPTNITPSNIA